ncbi:rhomboid family intramembrane serine protease [Pseudonocardia ailaonensis]|uniref:Rhomboid family intramembrane serine protease n=1 Tax=Pseudonocardia ailaonensis TaxID=367279 RepID=A0ABN2N0V0_9PSEU
MALPQVTPPPRGIARIVPPHPLRAAVIMLVFTAALYALEAVDQVTGQTLDNDGIISRRLDGLWGILWAPLLHGGWPHLISNTVPFLLFGWLAMAGGIRQWIGVTALIWVGSGALVWLTGPSYTSTIGMSGVIFGWLLFLLVRGFFARSARQIVLGVVLLVLEGGILWGVLPGTPGVSWQAHLFGALFGILAAWMVARADRRQAPAPTTPGFV